MRPPSSSSVLSPLWDECSAWAHSWGGLLPPGWLERGRASIERLAARRTAVGLARSETMTLRYTGRDVYARHDLAKRLGLGPFSSEAAADADLEVVELLASDAARRRREGWLIAPHFVRATVDLRVSASERWDRERRRRAAAILRDLEARVDEGGEGFDRFYDALYAPTTRARFGPGGYVARRRHLRRLARWGFLLHVDEGGERLGSALVARLHGRDAPLEVKVWGVTDPARRVRAHEAMFVFAMEEARRRGATHLGLGLGYPFAADGSLRFKKRWGATLALPHDDPRRFAVRALAPAGLEALAAHHLVVVDARGELLALGAPETPGLRSVPAPRTAEELRALARA